MATAAARQQVAIRKWSLNLDARWLFDCIRNCPILTRYRLALSGRCGLCNSHSDSVLRESIKAMTQT